MSQLLIRQLLIDLKSPFGLRWNGGDVFSSALMNALSMSFPVGEQFFLDAVRQGLKQLPAELQDRFKEEVKGFVGQEATHRRLHSLYNQHLLAQGMVNHWEKRATKRIAIMQTFDIRHSVAATAATEHFTAVFAHWLLANPWFLANADERLKTLWLWHASEESEHRCTAFDIYKTMGGNEVWRLRWMRRVTWFFLTDLLRQTMNNLWHDRALFNWSTWRSAWRHLFAQGGLFRECYGLWRDYFKPDFHPSQHPDDLSREWLINHENAYSLIGQTT
ncbi:MAG: metal-dependent hydrolase [Limnohabitans sp.]